MTTSLLSHHATDGRDLYAIVSVSAIRSLTSSQVQALAGIGIHRVSDLLHYRPIHDARLIAAIGQGQIAHDTIVSGLVDNAFAGTSAVDLLSKGVAALKTVNNVTADVFKSAFNITTIQQLADFKAFEEAQQFLTPTDDLFREAASAPSELMPKMVGAVQSTATYSSFVKEETLRLKGVELVYDNTRFFSVNKLLAGLFPVRGFELIRHSSQSNVLFPFPSRSPKLPKLPPFPLRTPEPVIKLGYVCKHTQDWVNFGTLLGEMVFSLALAPGESRNIATVDWTRSQRTRRSEDTTVNEQLTNELFHTRALDEVTRSTANEHQRGGTTIEAGTLSTAAAGVVGSAIAGGIAGAIPGAAIGAVAGAVVGTIEPGLGNVAGALAGAGAGAVIGFGVGAAISGGASLIGTANVQLGTLRSNSRGNREIEGSLRQTITETVNQKASAVRSLRSNIFVTDDQAEQEKLQTRNITNYNHSHMLNLEYFEVLQHYRVELRLTEAEPLLFLPFRPLYFTFELIRNYWSTLRRGVVPRSLREKFDRLIDGIESVSVSSEQQKLKTVTVQLTLSPSILSSTLQVTLTGQPDVQKTKSISLTDLLGGGFGPLNFLNDLTEALGNFTRPVVATAAFSFNNPGPNVENLTGLSVTGLTDSVDITVSIQTEDATGRAFRYVLRDSPVRPTDGIVNLPVNVGPRPDAGPNAIDEIERYFDERRYFFTRLLLLAIEKEQLIDLVEALQFQTTIEIPLLRNLTPDLPSLRDFLPGGITRLASAAPSFVDTEVNPVHFASGQARVATVAIEDMTIRVRDRMRDTLTTKIPAKNRATSAAAVSNVVEHALNVIRDELHRSSSVDAASITETAKLSVEAVKKALISTAGLTDRQATDVLKTTKLAEELRTSLTAAIKIPGILTVNVHLSEFIEPEPLAITGNTLVFRMKKVTDADVLNNSLVKGKLKPLVGQPVSVQDFVTASKKEITSHDVHLPTTGVFAEAILGRANASEKIDITRFFNWQDSPIPHLAPRIADLQAGGRAQPPLETGGPTVPASVVNIVNHPAFPDPTGLTASLAAIQNGNIFRDMSKSDQLVTVMSNLSNLAQSMANQAGSLAGTAQTEALRSAVDIGKSVAQLAAQSASQPANLPTTPTGQGAVANSLEKLFSSANSNTPQNIDAFKKILGVGENPSPLNATDLFKSKGDISGILNDFARPGVGNLKFNSGGENIELKKSEGSGVKNAGLIQLGADELPDNIDFWGDLILHQVPMPIKQALNKRGLVVQDFFFAEEDIELFSSPINLDNFEVLIEKMPVNAVGSEISIDVLFKELRVKFDTVLKNTNLLDENPFSGAFLQLQAEDGLFDGITSIGFFLSKLLKTFSHADFGAHDAIDLPVWESDNPLGAVMRFDTFADDMGVVASKFSNDNWIFSTIKDNLRLPLVGGSLGDHPVSGNRQFGFFKNPDNKFVFFTKGADRSTGKVETSLMLLTFFAGEIMWLSFQLGIKKLVESKGGKANILRPFSKRFEFGKVLKHFKGISI